MPSASAVALPSSVSPTGSRQTSVTPRAVLAKVGSAGKFRSLEHTQLLGMNVSQLLTQLAHAAMFAVDLKGVALGKCVVEACVSAQTDKPAADAVWRELEGITTVGELVSIPDSTSLLFLRVHLPAEGSAADLGTFVPHPGGISSNGPLRPPAIR